ncbi:MAG: pyruvate kinase [Coriobacteriia bacterium]|nr:pyruvate kinase [Coriobacteriia bacterium]
MRRTKIVATIGPACDEPGVLDNLVAAGVDVVRLNASHTAREDLERRLAAVRASAERAGRHVGVMLDLGGPKLRVGVMTAGTVLAAGSSFALLAGECVGDSSFAYVNHPGLAGDLSAGDKLLLDDGRLALRVTGTSDGRIETLVEIGGPLGGHKGVNIPGVRLALDPLTDKDIDDLAWAIEAGIDLIAQSFVRGPEDVLRLRKAMGDRQIPIVAKIEKHEAAGDIESIVAAADAVMVARGDLGVETSPEEVPVIQRAIVSACRAGGKPVIVATQMLESMVSAERPTRAEASDVANAVFEGADAVMLSAETAVGAHPVLAVETMARICVTAEEYGGPPPHTAALSRARDDVTRAVSAAVCSLATDLELAAIVTATESGATARAIASYRPSVPIVAITPEAAVARRLALVWGVHPEVVPAPRNLEEMAGAATEVARATGFARPGDIIALTAGVALNTPGTTDMVRVVHV